MNGWAVLGVVVLLVVLLGGFYLSVTAGRLDHLHRRIDTSHLALEAQLLRRSAVCLELASARLLDPAASMLLATAAHEARTSVDLSPDEHAQAESDLTAALVAALEHDDIVVASHTPEGEQILAELDAACRRVQLSRRFLNDAVRACRQLRRQRMVRLFRLAGRTPWPDTWEMDDSMPTGLPGR